MFLSHTFLTMSHVSRSRTKAKCMPFFNLVLHARRHRHRSAPRVGRKLTGRDETELRGIGWNGMLGYGMEPKGLELQDAKDASLARRKSLAELTKEFRKK